MAFKINRLAPLLGCVLACATGCQWWQTRHEGSPVPNPAPKQAATSNVSQIASCWENHVVVTEDSVNKGAPLIGVAGRLYLFGPDLGYPLNSAGDVDVELIETKAGQQPRLLEKWHIDNKTLQRLGKKDMIGWGYTLFLPWQSYRPDITEIQLKLAFTPEKCEQALYAQPSKISLRNDPNLAITQQRATPALQQTGLKK